MPDEAVINCQGCNMAFGALNRRHHCRRCGKIFCSSCTAGRARLPCHGFAAEPVRVCGPCQSLARREASLQQRHLPMMRRGDNFVKYGVIRQRDVRLALDEDHQLLRYWNASQGQAAHDGKRIEVQEIAQVVPAREFGFKIVTGDGQEYIFDAHSNVVRDRWVLAIDEVKDLKESLAPPAGRNRNNNNNNNNQKGPAGGGGANGLPVLYHKGGARGSLGRDNTNRATLRPLAGAGNSYYGGGGQGGGQGGGAFVEDPAEARRRDNERRMQSARDNAARLRQKWS